MRILVFVLTLIISCQAQPSSQSDAVSKWYVTDTPLESRSVSFENIKGLKGKGGMAKNALGVGRKGKAFIWLEPGQTVTIFDIDGPGVIRHIWMVPSIKKRTEHDRKILLGLVMRAYWENQDHASIEAPIGNFFGISHGKIAAYESVVHSVNPNAGMNIWAPMPFAEHAKITITNESPLRTRLFFNIDYTINDNLPNKFGRLHVHYRRENPTKARNDFAILPKRVGSGRYLGTVIGIRLLSPYWWGEGEFKVYLDGDNEFPTIVGTGTEDYIGHSYGIHNKAYLRAGVALNEAKLITIYRWHDIDPIFWKKDIRATIQQIGNNQYVGYYERQDDWNATTFWYEPIPSEPLPAFIDYQQRIADYNKPERISFENAIEAEKMKILSKSEGKISRQNTSKWWDRWSDNHHLVWELLKEGDKVTFEIPVKNTGTYEMVAGFTKNISGPILDIYWDGEIIKEGVDLHEWSWIPTGPVDIKTVKLSKGLHKLTLKIADSNPETRKPFTVGFDYLQLNPKDSKQPSEEKASLK